MSTVTWRGDAPAVAQVDTVVIGGSWATGESASITINGKSVTFTVGATQTGAAVVAGLVAAWNASVVPEHAEITAADANPNVTLTCDTAGMPFTATVSESSAAGTITISTTTANSGPAVASVLANYSTGALPTNDDTLVFENSGQDCLYDLEALAAVTGLTIIVRQSYSGKIGLPREHVNGSYRYVEYRPRYFKAGMDVVSIGAGDGRGSGRTMIDAVGSSPTVTIYNSAQSIESGIPPILIKGTGASTTIDVVRGLLGIAIFYGETGSVSILSVGYTSSQNSDSTVVYGSGATIGSIRQTGGKFTGESGITSLVQEAGEATFNGSAAVADADIHGTVYDNTDATWGISHIGPKGVYDHRRCTKAKSVSGAVFMDDGAAFHDPSYLVQVPDGWVCDPEKVTLNLGRRVFTSSGA